MKIGSIFFDYKFAPPNCGGGGATSDGVYARFHAIFSTNFFCFFLPLGVARALARGGRNRRVRCCPYEKTAFLLSANCRVRPFFAKVSRATSRFRRGRGRVGARVEGKFRRRWGRAGGGGGKLRRKSSRRSARALAASETVREDDGRKERDRGTPRRSPVARGERE